MQTQVDLSSEKENVVDDAAQVEAYSSKVKLRS
jgi:hypothetical protein